MLKHRTIALLLLPIIMGCNTDRSINYDKLITIKYVRGEELPYTGSSIKKYENGKTEFEAHYENGLLNGTFHNYYENGNKESETEYLNGKMTGHFINYYENGDTKSEGEYINGIKEGMWDWNSEDGKNSMRCNFVNDIKNGIHLFWNEDGTKQLTEFVDGELNGLLTVWHANGKLKEESYHVNWVQHGPFTYYDEEGKKIYSGEYKDGEVDWVEEY